MTVTYNIPKEMGLYDYDGSSDTRSIMSKSTLASHTATVKSGGAARPLSKADGDYLQDKE